MRPPLLYMLQRGQSIKGKKEKKEINDRKRELTEQSA